VALRRRTYCPKPFKARFIFARREWSICLTRSSSSSLSSFVQPSSVLSSGKMAYWQLHKLSSLLFSSPSSPSPAMRFNLVFSLSIVRVSWALSVTLYVGRRLTNLPSEGTKREFWTLVSVERVATSGSGKSQYTRFKEGAWYTCP
jgi:hypothetical protein